MKFKDMHSVDETDTNGLDIGALCMQLSTCSNTISAVLSPHSSSTHIFLSPTILQPFSNHSPLLDINIKSCEALSPP